MCSLQDGCIDWSVEEVQGPSTCPFTSPPVCVVKVCLRLDFDQTSCTGKQAGETISHVCDGSDFRGCPRDLISPGGLVFDDGSLNSPNCNADKKCNLVPDGTELCQLGGPGDTLYWVLKDGNPGQGSNPDADTVSHLEDGCEGAITCDLAKSVKTTCDDVEAQLEKENVWSYTIPNTFCSDCLSPASDFAVFLLSNHTHFLFVFLFSPIVAVEINANVEVKKMFTSMATRVVPKTVSARARSVSKENASAVGL